MKRIRIMSMQRVKNYGSFLQAFALKNMLQDLSGTPVDFVDFHFDKKKAIFLQPKHNYMKTALKRLAAKVLACIVPTPANRERSCMLDNVAALYDLNGRRYENEFYADLGVKKDYNYDTNTDLVVIGSDEVFNYLGNRDAGYADELIGQGIHAKRLVSYAACCGSTTLESLKKAGALDFFKSGMQKFDALSARDQNTCGVIEHLLGAKPAYHLDPVLCYDFGPFVPKQKPQKPYLVVYAYAGITDEYKQAITRFAAEKRLEIHCIMGYHGAFGKFMNLHPFEVLAHIQSAAYVVTNTFHGCVLSIKYNKSFGVIVRYDNDGGYSNNAKVGDLITRLRLNGREISSAEVLPDVLQQSVDYTYTNDYIARVVAEGKAYLQEQIAAALSGGEISYGNI